MYDLPRQLTYFRETTNKGSPVQGNLQNNETPNEAADILANSSAPRNAQRPQIHDVDDDPSPLDGLDIHCKDQFLDRDEDYTGLGIDSLNAIVQNAIE